MRRVLWIVLVASAACGPRVHPSSTFDEDDPRAGATAAPLLAAAPDAGAAPIAAVPPAGIRSGALPRADVNAVLDAGPAELLRGIEVSARRPDDLFAGWQLVRFVATAAGPRRFAAIDVAAGDVLLKINGRTLETPADLSALWLDLYRASAIDATIERGGQRFTLHFDITE